MGEGALRPRLHLGARFWDQLSLAELVWWLHWAVLGACDSLHDARAGTWRGKIWAAGLQLLENYERHNHELMVGRGRGTSVGNPRYPCNPSASDVV